MVLKYRGWALSGEYFDRFCADSFTYSPEGAVLFAVSGTGANVQLSKLLRTRYELATRCTYVLPDDALAGYLRTAEELLLGSTIYLNGHRIKLQHYLGYRWLDRQMALDHPGSTWTTMFQVEFGIWGHIVARCSLLIQRCSFLFIGHRTARLPDHPSQ